MEEEISRQEQELEERSLAALFETRPPGRMNWMSGKELAKAAIQYLEEHGDEIMAIIDEYRNDVGKLSSF